MRTFFGTAVLIVACGIAHADLITPEAATASSSFAIGPEALIDGSGLDGIGPVENQRHDNVENNMWIAGPGSQAQNESLEFKLDLNYDLSDAVLWQYNVGFDIFGNDNALRGIDEFEILVSPDLVSPFTSVGTFNLNIATDPLNPAGEAPQTFSLTGATDVRRVMIDINSAHGGPTQEFVGLSEIRFLGTPLPPGADRTWDVDGFGSWFDDANWDPGFAPNANNENAIFGPAISASSTVVVDQPVTVKNVSFDNANAYVIAGGASINFAADAGDAGLVGTSGAHQFQAVVNLQNNVNAAIATGATIEFVNRLNLNGNTLTKTGGGTLTVSNTLNTGGGSINCQDGTCNGGGAIGGDLDNPSGRVAPGSSIGSLTVGGNFSQAVGGTLEVEIGGLTAGTEFDQLIVNGSANLNGVLAVELVNGFSPGSADVFEILTASSVVNNGLILGGSDGSLFNLVFGPNNVLLSLAGSLNCDFDGGGCGLSDIDALVTEIAAGSNNLMFDVNGDGLVNQTDLGDWLAEAGSRNLASGNPYRFGDSNLDGVVDVPDFNAWNGSKFTPATWSSGDFNADGFADVGDFNVWNMNKFTSSLSVVPEPSTLAGLAVALAGLGTWRRRR